MTSGFPVGSSFQLVSWLGARALEGKASPDGTKTTSLSIRTKLSQQDQPGSLGDKLPLTFTAHLHRPTSAPRSPRIHLQVSSALWRPSLRRQSAVFPELASLKSVPFLFLHHSFLCLWVLPAASGRTWCVWGPGTRCSWVPEPRLQFHDDSVARVS